MSNRPEGHIKCSFTVAAEDLEDPEYDYAAAAAGVLAIEDAIWLEKIGLHMEKAIAAAKRARTLLFNRVKKRRRARCK